MKRILEVLRILVELVSTTIIMMWFWILGNSIGNLGARRYMQVYIIAQGSLWQILFAVIELSLGIWFFIALLRQLIPGGVKELLSEQPPTFAARVKYIPAIFALGVNAGLIGYAITIFIQQAASYLK